MSKSGCEYENWRHEQRVRSNFELFASDEMKKTAKIIEDCENISVKASQPTIKEIANSFYDEIIKGSLYAKADNEQPEVRQEDLDIIEKAFNEDVEGYNKDDSEFGKAEPKEESEAKPENKPIDDVQETIEIGKEYIDELKDSIVNINTILDVIDETVEELANADVEENLAMVEDADNGVETQNEEPEKKEAKINAKQKPYKINQSVLDYVFKTDGRRYQEIPEQLFSGLEYPEKKESYLYYNTVQGLLSLSFAELKEKGYKLILKVENNKNAIQQLINDEFVNSKYVTNNEKNQEPVKTEAKKVIASLRINEEKGVFYVYDEDKKQNIFSSKDRKEASNFLMNKQHNDVNKYMGDYRAAKEGDFWRLLKKEKDNSYLYVTKIFFNSPDEAFDYIKNNKTEAKKVIKQKTLAQIRDEAVRVEAKKVKAELTKEEELEMLKKGGYEKFKEYQMNQPRAWWFVDPIDTSIEAYNERIKYLENVIKSRPPEDTKELTDLYGEEIGVVETLANVSNPIAIKKLSKELDEIRQKIANYINDEYEGFYPEKKTNKTKASKKVIAVNSDESIKIFIGKVSNPSQGQWVTLPAEESKLEAIKAKAGGEPIISDFEAPFKISEYDDIFEINKMAKAYQDFDEYQKMAFAYFMNNGFFADEAIEKVNDGSYDFIEAGDDDDDFGRTLIEEGLFVIPEDQVSEYINYDNVVQSYESETAGNYINLDGNRYYLRTY